MVANYSSEELTTIAGAPMMAGTAVALVDIGIISSAIEAVAMSKEIAGAAKKYPNNTIIQSVFSEEALKSGVVKLEKPDIKAADVENGAVIERAIAAIDSSLEVLSGKATPEEIQEYKQFIYACADAVANAAGSGLFGSGAKVSIKEADALVKLKAALDV